MGVDQSVFEGAGSNADALRVLIAGYSQDVTHKVLQLSHEVCCLVQQHRLLSYLRSALIVAYFDGEVEPSLLSLLVAALQLILLLSDIGDLYQGLSVLVDPQVYQLLQSQGFVVLQLQLTDLFDIAPMVVLQVLASQGSHYGQVS